MKLTKDIMTEKGGYNPEIEALRQDKSRIFEEGDLAVRQEIENDMTGHSRLLDAWRNGGAIDGEPATTRTCRERLTSQIAETGRPPASRLSAFEHMLQLTERQEEDNRKVVEELIEHSLTEPDPRVQEAMLGILGSRLDARVVSEPEKYLPKATPEERTRLRDQFANTMDALINEIRPDPSLPEEYRNFAETVVRFSHQNQGNELWNRMRYMADLYRGDVRNLWPDFIESRLEPSESRPRVEQIRFERWIPKQKGRRLLPEFHVPSPEKQLQARHEPRASGSPDEIGQVLPLRVYAAFGREDGSYDIASLPDDLGEEFIAELRSIKMDRGHKTQEEKDDARRAAMDAFRRRVLDILPEMDKDKLSQPERLTLRVETLVDENLLNTLLKKRFGTADLDAIDPSGKLAESIDIILEGESETEEQFRKIGELLKAHKADGQT